MDKNKENQNKNKSTKNTKKQSINVNKNGFWKSNWPLLVLLFSAVIVIFCLVSLIVIPYRNKKSLENDISNMETTDLLSIDKVVCYSSAYGINNSESQARWNLNLSQFTDIAIYLNVQTNVNSMYIDNISFSNSDIGNLSLSYLPIENFGKSPITDSNYQVENVETPERIDLDLTTPITLRYLNNNLKENCLITDIDTPLSFDGSILKRGKVTISSIKNTVSFTLHITDDSNQEYTYLVNIPINLENTENEESIYDGSYTEEFSFENAYFYISK